MNTGGEPRSSGTGDLEARIREAVRTPHNLGEMRDADSVGTVGSPDCGDMLRMWIKFREENGRRVIDRASFQTFGCETAIAVASVATDLIAGKTAEEALAMSGTDLSAPLGPLPPMKIHCAQMVEGALRSALAGGSAAPSKPATDPAASASLAARLQPASDPGVRVVFRKADPA